MDSKFPREKKYSVDGKALVALAWLALGSYGSWLARVKKIKEMNGIIYKELITL